MKHMQRLVLLALALALTLAIPVNAAASKKNDTTEEAADEQAVYASLEIAESTDFDATVTGDELTTICKELFKKPANVIADKEVTWQQAVCETARAAGILPELTPESQKDPKKIKTPIVEYDDEQAFKFLKNAGKELKVWNRTEFQDNDTGMSKMELLDFTKDLTDYLRKNKSDNYGFGYVDVQYTHDKHSEAQLGTVWAGLIQTPFEILREFRVQKYHIEIRTNPQAVGKTLFSEEKATIWVYNIYDGCELSRTMSYFLNYICGVDEDALAGIFEAEKNAGMQLTCDKAGQNQDELFAEIFTYYTVNQNDDEAMQKLAQAMPKMAELFSNEIANDWYIPVG